MPSVPLPRMMRPVQVQLTHDASGADSRQVPASGASIAVAFQGTTVVAPAVCHDYEVTPVSVSGHGVIRYGDQLQVGGDPTKLLTVDSVSPDGSTLGLVAQDTMPLQLNAGDRLVVVFRPPALFQDAAGRLPILGNVVITDVRGYARFYCPEPNVDYLASGGGLSETLVFQDVEAGWGSSTRPTLNVLDFATFQDAHDALPPEGGTIFVPAGSYHSASLRAAFRGLVVTRPMALVGEANGYGDLLSQIHHDVAGANDIDAIFLNILGGVRLANLYVRGPGGTTPSGQGRGVRWYKSGTNVRMAGVTIENVVIEDSPNFAFEFICDGHSGNYVSKLEMIGCTAFNAKSGGSVFLGGAGSNNNWFDRCEFNGPSSLEFSNVFECSLAGGSPEVTLPSITGTPVVGDVVYGLGVPVGAKILSIDSASTPKRITLTLPAIETVASTTLSVARKWNSGTGQMRMGHVHLVRTTISRFSQCSFQGPGTEPALSSDLVSNDLELRDSYREKTGELAPVHSFLLNGLSNFLLDGLLQQFHNQPNRLLRVGPLGISMGRVLNAQLVTVSGDAPNSDVVAYDPLHAPEAVNELSIDHSTEFRSGVPRDLTEFGTFGPIPTAMFAAGTLTLPSLASAVFLVSEPNITVTAIAPAKAGVQATLVFKALATVSDAGTLKLKGSYNAQNNATLVLVSDGTNWYEVSRSNN